MRCLTFQESKEWLSHLDVYVESDRRLRFNDSRAGLMTTMPKGASSLVALCTRLASWASSGNAECVLWISNWETYPPEQIIQFETMRLGCGESRRIIDCPGHLFEPPSERSTAVLAGLIFLIVSFNWEGYLVPKAKGEYVFMGDEHLIFASANNSKMEEVAIILDTFHLEVIQDVRNAWK